GGEFEKAGQGREELERRRNERISEPRREAPVPREASRSENIRPNMPGALPRSPDSSSGAGNLERRMEALERRLEEVTRMLEEMRRGGGRGGDRGRGGGPRRGARGGGGRRGNKPLGQRAGPAARTP